MELRIILYQVCRGIVSVDDADVSDDVGDETRHEMIVGGSTCQGRLRDVNTAGRLCQQLADWHLRLVYLYDIQRQRDANVSYSVCD